MTTLAAERARSHHATFGNAPLPWALLILLAAANLCRGADPPLVEIQGQTMGTTYMVKLYDPPAMTEPLAPRIDAELRRVNDQMSTYLESSELSRFNTSDSTDWFPVSPETALVVDYAQQVAAATGGAFDVTVGPLVNAWGFGPGERKREVLEPARIRELQSQVGYEKLAVRHDPPALRKQHPAIQVDLSAIAKGHGVDRVVELLRRSGVENLFVEIGGEVRTRGDKNGQPWMVGIQRPDATTNELWLGHPLVDQAMATSGDYRNQFQVEGTKYSHSIDPRTGSPVTHQLASASVIARDCMTADAWATAINVLGPEAGLAAAKEHGLDVLLISRAGSGYAVEATGSLAASQAKADQPPAQQTSEQANMQFLPVMLVTVVAFGIILFGMAIGVIFGRRAISGSCGGLNAQTNPDGSTSCSVCSNPAEACRELRQRMDAAPEQSS